MKIYKHTFPWSASEVSIPNCLRILSVGVQNDLPVIWYAHSPKPDFEPQEVSLKKDVHVRMTGEDYPMDLFHIGTLMTNDHKFVIHLFI